MSDLTRAALVEALEQEAFPPISWEGTVRWQGLIDGAAAALRQRCGGAGISDISDKRAS